MTARRRLRLEAYVRVSRVGGRDKSDGYIAPEIQLERAEAYAAELGGEIVHVHDDSNFSGGTAERPGFQEAVARVRRGESDGVVVMCIDRFARSVVDGGEAVREILAAGGVFASCLERIDPKTPTGQYMLNSFLNNAELQLNLLKAGWQTAKERAVSRGAHIGPTPFGYERVPAAEPGAGKLRPHPIYGPAVTELFRRFAAGGCGYSDLVRWFEGRAPIHRAWTVNDVKRMLRGRVYLGEVHYRSRNGGRDLVNTSAHEPLIDLETWERCQRPPGERFVAHSSFLLTGRVRCAACRYSMGGFSYGGRNHDTPVYRCIGATRGCSAPSVIVAANLERYVIETMLEHLGPLAIRGVSDDGDRLGRLDRELAELDEEVELFASDVTARRLLGEQRWHEMLELRVRARDEKATERAGAFAEAGLAQIVVKDRENLTHDDLRDLLRGAVRHVFVRRVSDRRPPVGDRAMIVWTDDPAIDTPGPHRPGPFPPVAWRHDDESVARVPRRQAGQERRNRGRSRARAH